MTDYETVLVDTRGRIGVITLNRPEALNALNSTLMAEVVTAACDFDQDVGIGAIVLTGSDKASAAGADVAELALLGYQDAYLQSLLGGWDRFAAIRTPTIAAVAGFALGGGCELAMMCDIVLAAEGATFGQPEIKLGTIPGLGGTQRLTRAVGKSRAMELVLTGRSMSADEAARAGLVSRVVPLAQLHQDALEMATLIATRSLPVVYAAKEAVSVAFESSLTEGIRFERGAFYATFALDDRREGMQAFLQKRTPAFTNH